MFRTLFQSRTATPGETGLRLVTDFEGANAELVEVRRPGHLRFRAQPHRSPRPLWFAFCLEGATTRTVRCDLINADACLGPRLGWRNARPVFSPDGERWQRLSRVRYVEETALSGYFTFEVPVVGKRTWVAFSHPYPTDRLGRLLGELENSPGVLLSELCRTQEERPVPLLTFGNPEHATRSLWVISRQHAGEAPASFVAEGMALWLAGHPPPEGMVVYMLPMLAIDGVFHGHYGKDASPTDFNRDWNEAPELAEIRALTERLHQGQDRMPAALFLDLHAPHPADTSCYLFVSGMAPDSVEARLAEVLARETPQSVGFSASDVRVEPAPPGSARKYAATSLHAPGVTVEVSYHLAQSGRWLEPVDYLAFGGALMDAALQAIRPLPTASHRPAGL